MLEVRLNVGDHKRLVYKYRMELLNSNRDALKQVDLLHVWLTELHVAHQNLPPASHTLSLKETLQNIHQKQPKSDNMSRT